MSRNASTQAGYARVVVENVADALLARARTRHRPTLIGLSGLQGSGKSTLAAQLAEALRVRDVRTEVLSLDDFYLGRRARTQLAREVHPLLATRGVPGTHDVVLLRQTLDAIATASRTRPARIPRFDKGRDTRVAPSRWRRIDVVPRVILLEGWCIGVPAQTQAQLRRPVNTLERTRDHDARWRHWSNAQLAGDYARLWRRLDALVVLQAPSFGVVSRWRDEQERALRRRRAPLAMDTAALARFLMFYERLSRQALRALPAIADVRLVLDRERQVKRVVDRSP